MSTEDFPSVQVWANQGSDYALVGSIIAYNSLEFTPKHLEAGEWSLDVPYDRVTQGLTQDRLYTVDWRDHRTTWLVDSFTPYSETTHEVKLKVGGPSALALLGRDLAWPDPTEPLNQQTFEDGGPKVSAPAATVIYDVVRDNWVTRRGETLTLPPDTVKNLGTTVESRPKFDNLLEYVTNKARVGGLIVDLNLVNTTSTRARLHLQIAVPTDLTSRVRLSEKIGNLGSWSQGGTEPTATKAIVSGAKGGVDQQYREVTTVTSNAAASEWGGHRVALVQGPSSYDDPDLVQAGEEALAEGAATVTLAMEATDTPGLMAFRDYNVGDLITGELSTGLEVQDVLSSIKVTVDDSYPQVTATFGNPNEQDEQEPIVSMAEFMRHLNRRIRHLEQRS